MAARTAHSYARFLAPLDNLLWDRQHFLDIAVALAAGCIAVSDRHVQILDRAVSAVNILQKLFHQGREGKPEQKFYGFVFQDSDFAKWIEAVAYILDQYPDPELEASCPGYPRSLPSSEPMCAATQSAYRHAASNKRGRRPYYFDTEHPVSADQQEELRYQYHQAHLPVREQSEATGDVKCVQITVRLLGAAHDPDRLVSSRLQLGW